MSSQEIIPIEHHPENEIDHSAQVNRGRVDYIWVHFVKSVADKTWACLDNKSNLQVGIVSWYPEWNRFCYFSEYNRPYTSDCMDDISHFLEWLNEGK